MPNSKTAITSAIFGNIDNPKKIPPQKNPTGIRAEFFVYTDTNTEKWHLSKIGKQELPREKGKIVKMLAHKLPKIKDCDLILWLDGSLQVVSDEWLLFMHQQLEGHDLVVFKHPSRNNICEEANFVLTEIANGNKYLISRYNPDSMRKQIINYGREKTDSYGLFACGMFLRRNCPKVNACFEEWHHENVKLPKTLDQISFPVMLEKHGLNPKILDLNIFENTYFKFVPHIK